MTSDSRRAMALNIVLQHWVRPSLPLLQQRAEWVKRRRSIQKALNIIITTRQQKAELEAYKAGHGGHLLTQQIFKLCNSLDGKVCGICPVCQRSVLVFRFEYRRASIACSCRAYSVPVATFAKEVELVQTRPAADKPRPQPRPMPKLQKVRWSRR